MIETKNIRNLYAENMDDDLDKIISLDFLKNNYISGGSTLGGTQYLFVSGSGTPEENGVELQEAYEAAEKMPRYLGDLSDVQFYTKYFYKGQTFKLIGFYYKVIEDCETSPDALITSDSSIGTTEEQAESNKTIILVAPGTYKFGIDFETNLSGVRLSSITGEMDVIIDGNINQTKDDQEFIGLDLRNNTFSINSINTNSVYKNISALGDNSFSSDENDIDGTFYKCVGGVSSFCGNYYTSGNFYNCAGGIGSFSGEENTNGNFYDCVGGVGSFGGVYETSGNFHNCVGAAYSFGSGSTVSGNFYNCTGGDNSFGSGGVDISGTFYNCIGGLYSFGSNTYNNLTSSARLYYCKLISGTFTTPNPGGKLVLCIDGDNNVVTTDDSTIPISPISTSVFEKNLAQNDTYDWGADLTIDEKDDVYFISLNPEVATVNQNGVVTAISEESSYFAEILAVGKSSRESLLVIEDDNYAILKFKKKTDGYFMLSSVDSGNESLIKPDGSMALVMSGVPIPCDAGICYLKYHKDISNLEISSNELAGEIKTGFSNRLDVSNNQLASLSLPNAGHVYCSNNQLISLSAPNATSVNCDNNQLTASAIAALLAELKDTANENGYLHIGGTGNAGISKWTAQAIADKDYLLNTLNWEVIYNS